VSLAHFDQRASDSDLRMHDGTVRRSVNSRFLCPECALQKIDHPVGTAWMQVWRHASKPLGDIFFPLMRGDPPVVARQVFHTRFAIAIRLVNWLRNRGGARLQRALVNRVRVIDVEVKGGRHNFATPPAATTNHYHGITDPNLAVNTSPGASSAVKLIGTECVFHKVDQPGRFIDNQISSNGMNAFTNLIDWCRCALSCR